VYITSSVFIGIRKVVSVTQTVPVLIIEWARETISVPTFFDGLRRLQRLSARYNSAAWRWRG